MKNIGWGLGLLLFSLSTVVAVQATPPLVVDGDNDGVSDEIDDCPYTPPNTAVDARGCPLAADGDGDGVPDAMDDCPYTPKGAQVDAHGCAIDSDLDGVPDGIDLCPHSTFGERVDADGCEPGARPLPLAKKPPTLIPRPRTIPIKPAPDPAALPTPKTGAPSISGLSPAADAVPEPAVEPRSAVPPAPAKPASSAKSVRKPSSPPTPKASAKAQAAPAVPQPAPVPSAETEKPAIGQEETPAPAASAAPGPVLADIEPAKPHANGLLIVETLGAVRFAHNSAELSDNEMQHLQRLVDEVMPRLVQLDGSGLLVTAHRLAREPAGLDTRRAEVIRGYLLAKGLPHSRVRLSDTVNAPRKDASGQTAVLQLLPVP